MEEAVEFLRDEIMKLRLLQGILANSRRVPLEEMGLTYLASVAAVIGSVGDNLDELAQWIESEP
ncbi:hypothetical protein [Desulfatiglans anilini]|uniref:hypothetical protein n=1 Tax=Desulfatiglans anilini TaxID=90728 RepID=UPI0003F80E76|nr:hypothetical protein [Desulfatiglans anilini]